MCAVQCCRPAKENEHMEPWGKTNLKCQGVPHYHFITFR